MALEIRMVVCVVVSQLTTLTLNTVTSAWCDSFAFVTRLV